MSSYKLLSVDSNAKTPKGEKKGFLTGVLYLAPIDLSGFQVCPMATEGCKRACRNTAGRGFFKSVQDARIAKTQRFFNEREAFLADLASDINRLCRVAELRGLRPAVRLNGTSDILWERIAFRGFANVLAAYPQVTFYDYTKHLPRKRTNLPANYFLTYSYNEGPDAATNAADALAAGWNVAVVFSTARNAALPATFTFGGLERLVIDGDADDLRFLDMGQIVGLHAKGAARADKSGFVVQL